jgi:hypothetical protein
MGGRDPREVGMTPTSLYSHNSSSVLAKYFDNGGLDISHVSHSISTTKSLKAMPNSIASFVYMKK